MELNDENHTLLGTLFNGYQKDNTNTKNPCLSIQHDIQNDHNVDHSLNSLHKGLNTVYENIDTRVIDMIDNISKSEKHCNSNDKENVIQDEPVVSDLSQSSDTNQNILLTDSLCTDSQFVPLKSPSLEDCNEKLFQTMFNGINNGCDQITSQMKTIHEKSYYTSNGTKHLDDNTILYNFTKPIKNSDVSYIHKERENSSGSNLKQQNNQASSFSQKTSICDVNKNDTDDNLPEVNYSKPDNNCYIGRSNSNKDFGISLGLDQKPQNEETSDSPMTLEKSIGDVTQNIDDDECTTEDVSQPDDNHESGIYTDNNLKQQNNQASDSSNTEEKVNCSVNNNIIDTKVDDSKQDTSVENTSVKDYNDCNNVDSIPSNYYGNDYEMGDTGFKSKSERDQRNQIEVELFNSVKDDTDVKDDDKISDDDNMSVESDNQLDIMELAKCFMEREPIVRLEILDLDKYKHIIKPKPDAGAPWVVLRCARVFPCDRCRAAFLSARDCHKHRLQHRKILFKEQAECSGEYAKRLECPDCERRFVHAATLAAHAAVHRPRPHRCRCGVGFYQRADLRQHRRLLAHWPQDSDGASASDAASDPEPSDFDPDETSDFEPEDAASERRDVAVIKVKIGRRKQKKNAVGNKKKGGGKKRKANGNKKSTESSKEQSVTSITTEKLPQLRRRRRTAMFPEEATPQRDALLAALAAAGAGPGGRYACPRCPRSFPAPSAARQHLLRHTGERPFRCDVCDRCFTQSGALKLHVERHMGVRHACAFCPRTLSSAGALALHERSHTGARPLACAHCPRRFADPSARARHQRIHTRDFRYACEHCPKRFTDASAWIVHTRRHEGARPHACGTCGRRYYTRADLAAHARAAHAAPAAPRYTCAECDRAFSSKGNLAAHIHNLHLWRPVRCKMCGETVANKYVLQRHRRERHRALARECRALRVVAARGEVSAGARLPGGRRTVPVPVVPLDPPADGAGGDE